MNKNITKKLELLSEGALIHFESWIDSMGINFSHYIDFLLDEKKRIDNSWFYLLTEYVSKLEQQHYHYILKNSGNLQNLKDIQIIFNEYNEGLKILEESNHYIVKELKTIFVKTNLGNFLFKHYPNIKKHEKEVLRLLANSTIFNELRVFLRQVEEVYNNFMCNFYSFRLIMIDGAIVDNSESAIAEQVGHFDIISPNLLKNKEVVYVDQNILTSSKNIDFLKDHIQSYLFIFSMHSIEDAGKMNEVFFNTYLSNLKGLSYGYFIGKYNNSLEIVKEDTDLSLDRVSLWLYITELAEKRRLYQMKLNFHLYPEFRTGGGLSTKINEDIKKFFTEDITESEAKQLNKIFMTEVLFSIEDLKNGYIDVNNKSDFQIMNIIERLCSILDKLNFSVDKLSKPNIIRSGYQDSQHIMHSWTSRYLLSEDKNLRTRANYIYDLLGVNTKAISLKEFGHGV